MIDYEKVKQGLKSCSGMDECHGKCPYEDGYDSCTGCTSRLAKDAYQLLTQMQTKGGNEMDKNKMDHRCSYNAVAGIIPPHLEKNPNNLMSTDGELKQWQRDILNDPVNHPSHYTDGKIEVIDFIEDKKLGFHLGNAVKYIARAGKKDPSKEIEDLKKAIWYINRRIANISGDTDGDSELINQKIEPLTYSEARLIHCDHCEEENDHCEEEKNCRKEEYKQLWDGLKAGTMYVDEAPWTAELPAKMEEKKGEKDNG